MILGQILKKRYGITHPLGGGKYCQTYLAEDLQLPGNPQCVIKLFQLRVQHPKILKLARRIFAQESEILTNLGKNSQFPEIFEAFEWENRFVLVQEWVKGEDLGSQCLPEQPWSESAVMDFLQASLEALAIAHQQQIVHRNLKPSNVIRRIQDQQWMLLDFGGIRQICTLALSPQGMIGVKGTLTNPGYLPPPERRKPTCSSDVYSLGVMALQAFTGLSPAALVKDSERGELQWRDRLPTPLSDPFGTILEQMVAVDPSQRYPSATEALQELKGRGRSLATTTLDPTSLDSETTTQILTIPSTPPPTLSTPLEGEPLPSLLGGRYHILKALGNGGFGQTFLAEDCQLPGKPKCVVKQLKPYRTTPAALKLARRLFDSEAQVLNQLGRHPQIPQLLAHFEDNNEFYLVQDYIEGHDLEKELPLGHKLDELTVVALLRDILQVLTFVHEQKVIHRDLKPANIRRREDGKIVLIDFGAVKQIGERLETQEQTKLTVSIGTPGYIPSEQAQGKPKLASDIYAVGIIGIQALTGLNPEYLKEHQKTGELRWRDRAQVSPYFAKIIDKMVRYDFRRRYPSASEALAALDDLIAHPQMPVIYPSYWLAWLEDNRILGGLGMTIFALLSAFFALSLFPSTPPADLTTANQTPTPSPAPNTSTVPTPSLPTLPNIQKIPLPFNVVDADYTPREAIVMVSNTPNQLVIYYPRSRRQVNIPLASPPLMVALSPNGQFAAVGHTDSISWVNLQREQVDKTIPVSHPLFALVVADQNWIYGTFVTHTPFLAHDITTRQDLFLSDARNYAQTVYRFDAQQKNLYGIINPENAQSSFLRHLSLVQGKPQFQTDYPIKTDLPLGQLLGFLADGRLLTENGVMITLPTPLGGEIHRLEKLPDVASLNLTGKPRIAASDRTQTLLAIHSDSLNGTSFNRLSFWKYDQTRPYQTYQLPPLTDQPEAPPSQGEFIFVNRQGNQYYLIVKNSALEQYSLLIGSLNP